MNIPDIITLIAIMIVGGYLLQNRIFCQHQKLSDIVKGLPCRSWVFGNIIAFRTELDFGALLGWHDTYGAAYTVRGCLGETRLVISDPAAFKFFFQNPYKFSRPPLDTLSSDLINGSGAVFSEIGPSHRRLRGVMDLAFRKYASSFQEGTDAVIQRWIDQCQQNGRGEQGTINVQQALGKFALTESMHAVLGDTPESDSKKHTAQKMWIEYSSNILSELISKPTKRALIIERLAEALLPKTLLRIMLHLPEERLKRLHRFSKLNADFVNEILVNYESKQLGCSAEDDSDTTTSPKNNGSSTSIFSAMVRINEGLSKSQNKLTLRQIASQVPSMLIAGQDTVGNSLSWALYELASHPDWQERVREEIIAHARFSGDTECPQAFFRNEGLDGLPCLNAHIKETLRFYPGVPMVNRITLEDVVFPLAEPILSADGKSRVTQILVQKGTRVHFNLAAYNKTRSIWGEDAGSFDPWRWLPTQRLSESEQGPVRVSTGLGPYANLSSFIGGARVCVGWRLSILLMQTFLTRCLAKFRFKLVDNVGIRPIVTFTIFPALDNDEDSPSPSLPLGIEML
ncbi:cytochrome P450 [Lentinula detonsa]|uniref:Cytochrome P450 n=1 Tax=Lentinula detonsa TaxID=2804962 RepID=A0AA38PW57_9AGAR|nr:cytochrome P450 [Lentinula detonsa]